MGRSRAAQRLIAAVPPGAVRTLYPAFVSMLTTTDNTVGSSSTTRIVLLSDICAQPYHASLLRGIQSPGMILDAENKPHTAEKEYVADASRRVVSEDFNRKMNAPVSARCDCDNVY